MESERERIIKALEKTRVIRPPRRPISIYGPTAVNYFVVSEPVYQEIYPRQGETVLRTGKVIYSRPRILTPNYLRKIEGFSLEAQRALDLIAESGEFPELIQYAFIYRNEPEKMEIFSETLPKIIRRLNLMLDRKKDPFGVIIQAVDELWDVSLMKFLQEMIFASHFLVVPKLAKERLFELDRMGIPRSARIEIEELFELVKKGKVPPQILHQELERWGLFEQYQDRFFALFRK